MPQKSESHCESVRLGNYVSLILEFELDSPRPASYRDSKLQLLLLHASAVNVQLTFVCASLPFAAVGWALSRLSAYTVGTQLTAELELLRKSVTLTVVNDACL